MTVGTARPLRSLAICQISHLYHKISVCKEPVKSSGQICRKFFALCPISGASTAILENIVDWAWAENPAQHGSAYVRDRAWIPGPAGVAGGKRRGRTRSEKGGRGAFLRQAPPVLAARACGARDAKRHGHRAWAAVCAGERTDDGAGHSPPRRSGSRFSGGVGSGAHTEARGERTGCQGEKKPVCAGERTGRRGGASSPTSIGLPVQRGEAGRGKGEVRADPAECNSPRTVRAGRFALDPGGYLSSRAVSSQVLSAYEGLTAVFGMGTGGTPQLNHRKLPVP